MTSIPQIVQYQGSKRKLASQIIQHMPKHFNRLIEPFCGMAAMTIAVAIEHRAQHYFLNDLNEPIIGILKAAVERPDELIKKYENVWNEQFKYEDHTKHFYEIRELFNNGQKSPENMLYLLARCVKGAVRYGKDGKFNQSPDKRRHGTTPQTLKSNVLAVSSLLKGCSSFSAVDYRELFEIAVPGDIIYMDPPYQGVSNVRDNRYLSGLTYEEFASSLYILNKKGIDFIISYDGSCGDKNYGVDLPEDLECKKILLNAGLSTQTILLGAPKTTYEALYISRGLQNIYGSNPKQLDLMELICHA